jgi:hypothetical protein
MDTKLTLKLDSKTIDKMKVYAKKNHQTLSALVESYFENITTEAHETPAEYSPVVKQLMGKVNLPKDYDFKKEQADHLRKKYK